MIDKSKRPDWIKRLEGRDAQGNPFAAKRVSDKPRADGTHPQGYAHRSMPEPGSTQRSTFKEELIRLRREQAHAADKPADEEKS